MDAFAPFVPLDRLCALATGVPLAERADGAALFADISGFTPLTEAFARELGPKRGAEQLTRQLNDIYDALVTEVHAWSGSVMNFAGDAITCWFDDQPVSGMPAIPSPGPIRAERCAHAIQRAMSRFATVVTPAGEVFPLAVKVAVASGPVRRLLAGNPAVQLLDAMAGNTVLRMAAGEHLAERGEVVVDEATARHLPEASVREWRSDEEHDGDRFAALVVDAEVPVGVPRPLPLPEPSEDSARAMGAWVLPDVRERLVHGGASLLAEIRPATALFARFSGIDYDDDPDAGEKLDGYVCWVQSVVTRYGGNIIQLTLGDKGAYLYAAFGAPVAHEDDSARAVAVALELQHPPEHLGYISPLQIGLSQGRMRTGTYGGVARTTYGVLGDETNLSARLMTYSRPGQIVISGRLLAAVTRRASTLGCEVRPLGAISVKGKREPLEVFEVVRVAQSAAQASVADSGQLIGREGELGALGATLEDAHASGRLVAVVGQAGIGKSHVAEEFAREASGQGSVVLSTACPGAGFRFPYAPWRAILTSVLALDGRASIEAADVRSAVETMREDLVPRAPLLADVFGITIPDTDFTGSLEPRVRQQALLALVIDLLRTWLARQSAPALFWLDDAHQIDESSLSLLTALARVLPGMRVVLLLTYRGTEEAAFSELTAQPHARVIELGALDDAALAKLMQFVLGAPLNESLSAFILERSRGNPYFALELIAAMRAAEAIHVGDEGTWRLTADAGALALPTTLQGVVLARVDRLEERQKLALKVASVIGRRFESRVLRYVHPARPTDADLGHTLAALRRADVLDAVQTSAAKAAADTAVGETCQFRDAITHEVIYDLLLEAQQLDLHSRIGATIETLIPDAVERIAYHAYLGQDWPRAMNFQWEAGERASRRYANRQAFENYTNSLAASDHLPLHGVRLRRMQVLLRLGELLVTTGVYDSAEGELNRALELATALDDHDAAASACRWLARSFELRGDYARALSWIARGQEELIGRETTETVELCALAGLVLSRRGERDAALEQCERALDISRRLGAAVQLARAYTLLGHIKLISGNAGEAIDHFRESLSVYEASGNLPGQAVAQNQIANAYIGLGQLESAVVPCENARRLFGEMGDLYNRALADNSLGEIARAQGRLVDALSHYSDALAALAQTGGSLYAQGAISNNMGAAHIRNGDFLRAREQLSAAAAMFEKAQARDFLAEMHRLSAEASLGLMDMGVAREQAGTALSLARELKQRGEEGNALRVLGEIEMKGGSHDAALPLLHQALEVQQSVGNEYDAAIARLSIAKLHLALGDVAAAEASAEASAEAFERLGAQLDADAARMLVR